jgi:hypothetical protein
MKELLKDKIEFLRYAAFIHGWQLNRIRDFQKAKALSDYYDYKLNRVLTQLKIEKQ